MTKDELKIILDKHALWFADEKDGERADLRGAYLTGAYLTGADLRGADLRGAKELPYIPLSCPDTGAFIGWKKAKLIIDRETNHFEECIVKIEICADARRSSAMTEKCRADKVEVLQFETLDGKVLPNESSVASGYDDTFHYVVGEIIRPTSFDDNRWNECAPGIHFFINRQSAVNYLI